jgi:peptidyl carrier protein
MTRAEISARLLSFIRERFLDDDADSDLNEGTPLVDWGLLNSMNTAELLSFIHTEFARTIPPASVTKQNFKNVDSITAMVLALAGPVPASERREVIKDEA